MYIYIYICICIYIYIRLNILHRSARCGAAEPRDPANQK